uniref:Vacuolar protein sorting-associated protein 54 n=1 Tax=Albugo laibachii Nc14 TaxID=890382 RepID=F0W2M8_9STRA|nr:vacuolar protein sortingassociated protein putative [Albugo laibachii Nc14]|eukprot:CCA15314.1 vacuolar protein sortingassociated protein putative [Albugo laibachii Nc14]
MYSDVENEIRNSTWQCDNKLRQKNCVGKAFGKPLATKATRKRAALNDITNEGNEMGTLPESDKTVKKRRVSEVSHETSFQSTRNLQTVKVSSMECTLSALGIHDDMLLSPLLDSPQATNFQEATLPLSLPSCDIDAHDIISYYRFSEMKFSQRNADYMMMQMDITPKMRFVLTNWLLGVHHHFNYAPETLHITVYLIDYYLGKTFFISRHQLQLVGVVAFFIASKYEEISPPFVEDLAYLTQDAYTCEDIVEMEHSMLNTVNYRISFPTAIHFLNRFIQAAQSWNALMKPFSMFYVDHCLLDYHMNAYLPSMVAASAIYLARLQIGEFPLWSRSLELHTCYMEWALQKCVAEMKAVVQRAQHRVLRDGPISSIHRKYATKEHLQGSHSVFVTSERYIRATFLDLDDMDRNNLHNTSSEFSSVKGLLSPKRLIKKGWEGISVPFNTFNTFKNSLNPSTTPSSASSKTNALLSTSRTKPPQSVLHSPSYYPGLFAIPNNAQESLQTPRMGMLPHHTPLLSVKNAQTEGFELENHEQELATFISSHHNLHSVLIQPKSIGWSAGTWLDVFSPSEVEMLPPPDLEIVLSRDFDAYLKKHGKHAQLYAENHKKSLLEQLSSSHVPSIQAADEDVAECLRLVPSLFFRPDFDLTDPAIFEGVMSLTSISETPLQEQLSGYLDRVEFTLLRQVSSRADRFFEASSNQERIVKSVKTACGQVATLRKTMDRLRTGLADKTLDIVSLHRRQKRIAELHDLVINIETIKQSESAIEALVHSQDFTSALHMIEQAETLLRQHLTGIYGLNALQNKLEGYRSFIKVRIGQRFLSVVTSSDWILSDESLRNKVATKRMDASACSVDESLTRKSKQLVDVLFRLDGLCDVIGQYRGLVNDEIKLVVKTVVTDTIASSSTSAPSKDSGTPSTTDATDTPAESKISTQLRALSSDEFLQCIQMIFEHLLIILKRAVVVQKILTDCMNSKSPECSKSVESLGHTEAFKEEDWKNKSQASKVLREYDDLMRKTCEFSQRSVSNLFAVRKEVQAIHTMPQLRLLYDTTMQFVTNLEKATSKTDYTLRGALFSQLKLFLEKYHTLQVAKLISTLDHELWKNTEISIARHKALEDLSSGRGAPATLWEDREFNGETSAPLKAISICGKTFKVVWSVLLMLEIVMNYMSCAANFPVLATDVSQRCVEIFRLFNSRTTQLVLGAGAMQIARLKSISARHLGVASQSLELAMTLLPHIKAALAAHFSDRQKALLGEFDRVLRDYAEHNEKIFSKFTAIVEEQIMKRFLENVAAEVDYDSSNVEIPSIPMRGISQNTLKLYQVLNPVLPVPQMKDLMTRVFDMFTQKLPDCFKLVQPRTEVGKKRCLQDIHIFVNSFGDVHMVQFHGEQLVRHFERVYGVSVPVS